MLCEGAKAYDVLSSINVKEEALVLNIPLVSHLHTVVSRVASEFRVPLLTGVSLDHIRV